MLSWTGSNASSYDVYFGTSPNPSSYVTTTSGTTHSASGLNNNTAYYWKIVARIACGDLTHGTGMEFHDRRRHWHTGHRHSTQWRGNPSLGSP